MNVYTAVIKGNTRINDTKSYYILVCRRLKCLDNISKKIFAGIRAMRKIRKFTNWHTLKLFQYGLIQSDFDYCCEVWNSTGTVLSDRLQKLRPRWARIFTNYEDEHGQSQLPWII